MKDFLIWARAFVTTIKAALRKRFVTKFPGKSTLNLKAVGVIGTPALIGIAITYCLLSASDDTSRLSKSAESIQEKLAKASAKKKAEDAIKGISKDTPASEKREKQRRQGGAPKRLANINYRAKQVIERADYSDPSTTLPRGTAFVGRLGTAIDTRNSTSLVQVELPYGGSFQGNEILPRDSVMFATVSYDGNGEKVFLDFQSGNFPDGQQFQIRAQALSSRDYSPGIDGDYHGTFTNRVASTLGLSFVAGLTDALQEKESLGSGGAFQASPITPKPTLKNGLLAGVSKVTESESQRMAQEYAGQKPYVTVESGKELIVSLIERFVKGSTSEPGQRSR